MKTLKRVMALTVSLGISASASSNAEKYISITPSTSPATNRGT